MYRVGIELTLIGSFLVKEELKLLNSLNQAFCPPFPNL